MAMPLSKILRAVLSGLFLTVHLLANNVQAKKVSGSVRLSGVDTEQVLAKFALSPYAIGQLTVKLVTSNKKKYQDTSRLRVRLFTDTSWDDWKKTPLCTDKIRLANTSHPVDFLYRQNDWVSSLSTNANQATESRPHFWYVVLDDCSLEEYMHDDSIPELDFEIFFHNDIGGNETDKSGGKKRTLTHLSADETGIQSLNSFMLLCSTALTFLMTVRIGSQLMTNASVHAALFLVTAASVCNTFACLSELIHMKVYETNGYGSYTLDAFSSHFEAMCDSIVAILLLSIAAGWTLPSDAVAFQIMGASKIQTLLQGFRNPAGALLSGNPAGLLAIFIIAVHATLAQWGRMYNDDFDSYHALEHLPGRILMIFRILLGLMLVVSSMSTASMSPNRALKAFYIKLAIVGTIWFQSMPLVSWICGLAVPYYLRHPAVATGSAIAQLSSLLALAWLVTAHSSGSSYHKLSRLSSQGERDLTDQLGSARGASASGRGSIAPKFWKIGKTKIRLD